MVLCRRVAVIICLAVVAVTASVAAQVVPLPSGEVSGGIVDDDGRARVVILVGDEGNDPTYASLTWRPVLIELGKGRVVGKVMPGEDLAGLSLGAFLDSGDILLTGSQGPVVGGYTAAGAAIVSVRGDEVERRWRWYSRTDFPECKSHCAVPEVSRDGRMWAFGWDQGNPESGMAFEIGWIGEPNDSRHMEHVDFPDLSPSASPDGSRHFWFLDTSDGLVVLVPWRGGGYIVHFRRGASPQAIPVLQGAAEPLTHWWEEPSTYWWFHWQHEDRVLWAEADEQLRAYNLPDLGVSGFPDAPFWEMEGKDGWKVHPERGVVRIVSDEGSYRIEHAWRDPWTGFEERHLSDGTPGPPPTGRRVLVSPNGRHAVVLESRESDDSADGTPVRTRNQARRLAMTIQPSAPPIPAATAAPTPDGAGDPAEQPQKPPPER